MAKYLLAGFLLLFLNACTSQSSGDSASGREYLESVQSTVEETTKEVAPGIVYMELQMKKAGRAGNSITLNGLIIDEKGHVATLYFKEEDVSDIKIWLGEEEYMGKVIKSDRINGMTILKIDSDEKTVPVKFGDTSKLMSGQFLIGVSASSKNLAFEPVSNVGTLKAIIEGARDVVMVNGFQLLHTNDIPAIGMPLFNLDGEVVAVGQGRTIGLIDNMSKAVGKFIKRKDGEEYEDAEPWIGINYEAVTDEVHKALEVPREAVRVTRVYESSPAWKGGLRPGDIVVGIDGNDINRRGIRALSQVRKWMDPEVGRTCVVTTLVNGKKVEKSITFEKKLKITSISIEEFGLTVNDISPIDKYTFSLKTDKGVLVTGIERGSPAATSTYFGRPLISRGDVIKEVHGHKINNIRLQRGNRPTSVSLDTAIGQKTKDGVN